MDNRPIGVFDSGVGGMTVLKELRKKIRKLCIFRRYQTFSIWK